MRLLLASFVQQLTTLLLAFFSVFLLPGAIRAQKIDKSKLDNAAQRSRTAGRVLTAVVNHPGDTIPRELIDRTRAVGVFPELDRMSFLMPKSRLAYGVICSRLPGGWSPPAYYGFGAPKLDLMWKGDKKPDIIILFMSDKAMEEFQKGNFRFKDEMVGFAGPVGELTREKESSIRAANVIIYALVDGRVEGLRVDADVLGGGAANPDNNLNNAIYGLKGREVLSGKAPLWPSVLPSVSEYQNVLTSLSKQ
jgi:lipid-binding SYLF domain-containing protein